MPNRLAQTQSLYLRKHAENPIDWWPWCDEALETAKAQNKPIFLSIGYSSCHWCTVMEGEAFSDRAIAEYMNANFLPIKVDREERPDLDSIYMQALQMMTGQGGWPLNVFLSPDDRVPFYGGTYFPVEPRYGRPGFLQVLQAIRRFYDLEKAKLKSVKEEIFGYLQQSTQLPAAELNDELLRRGLEANTAIIAAGSHGPCFPTIPYAEIAQRAARFKFETKYDAAQVAMRRGLDLVLGGIYDHVGGGFHRYTVDASWTVPHFEKMLYDNGQILEYLANLWSMNARVPDIDRAIAATVQWLKREMTAPAGYFYAAQDADSFADAAAAEPEEGHFYVWSYSELEQLLSPDELAELKNQFFVTPEGNFEGRIVLKRRYPGELSDTVLSALAKLFQVRYGAPPAFLETFPPARDNQEAKTTNWPGRIPPVTDTKMIVAWNSLMISGLARASTVFNQPEYLDLAVKAAHFIVENQWTDGRFQRINYDGKAAVTAQSEDYALFVKALLDLHQASQTSPNPSIPAPHSPGSYWLEKALKVQAEFDEFLWSGEMGGYYNTASDKSQELLVRERSYIDNAIPSANGIAIANLVRLALLAEDLQYLEKADRALQGFGSIMNRSAQACPSLFAALDWYQNYTLIRSSAEEIAALVGQYLPTCVFKVESDLPAGSVGLVCQGLACKEPALDRAQLWEQIQQSQARRSG